MRTVQKVTIEVPRQGRFAEKYLLPVRALCIHDAWLRRAIVLPGWEDPIRRRSWLRAAIYPQPLRGLEPVREETARRKRIQTGGTLQDETEGGQWIDRLDQRVVKNTAYKKAGLAPPHAEITPDPLDLPPENNRKDKANE